MVPAFPTAQPLLGLKMTRPLRLFEVEAKTGIGRWRYPIETVANRTITKVAARNSVLEPRGLE